jgi:hypothetical protein
MDNRTPEQWITETLDDYESLRVRAMRSNRPDLMAAKMWNEYTKECEWNSRKPEFEKDDFLSRAFKYFGGRE